MENVGTGPRYSIVIFGANILIASVPLCDIVTIGFCRSPSPTVLDEEDASNVPRLQSIELPGAKASTGCECVPDVCGSSGVVSGSGELDPARPDVVGELGFVLVGGIVATRACSAEITTLGGTSWR